MFRRDLLWVAPLTLVTLFLMFLLMPSILWLVGIPWFIATLGLGIGLSLIGLPPTIAFIGSAIVSAALGLCLLILLFPPPPSPALLVKPITAPESAGSEAPAPELNFDAE